MEREALAKAAAALADLRRSGSVYPRPPDGLCPASIDEGYDLQAAVSALLEDEKGPCCGYKIGCTTPVMQEFLSIDHPCAGRLYETEVIHGSVTLRLADFVRAGVECEIALRLGRDLAPAEAPFRANTLAGAVDAVMAAAEIVDERYQDFHAFGIPGLIADDFFSAGAVIGEARNLQAIDLPKAVGRTEIDGQVRGTGLGEAVLGNPLNALAWLANQRAARGEGMKAGDLVMTGSVVATQWIEVPCTVTCSVEPLGQVQITFV